MDQELLKKAEPVIEKIAKNRCKKVFAYFTADDLYQEIWVLCIQALEKYEPSRGKLEHYLNRHVTNRLSNLKRDKYFNSKGKSNSMITTRINLVNALPIDIIDIENNLSISFSGRSTDPSTEVAIDDRKINILIRLPARLRYHFLDLINGNKIKKSILDELRSEIFGILKELDYE